jgi:hypothetical protein
MALEVRHRFVSAIPDAEFKGHVRPSDWNDLHEITGTVGLDDLGDMGASANDFLLYTGAAW